MSESQNAVSDKGASKKSLEPPAHHTFFHLPWSKEAVHAVEKQTDGIPVTEHPHTGKNRIVIPSGKLKLQLLLTLVNPLHC